MLDGLLSIIAPHYCCWCGKIGSLLCADCKYDITSEPYEGCVPCGSLISGANNLCHLCRPAYSSAWCVGDRRESLQRLIGLYKFQRTYSGYRQLAELLDERLPVLPANVVIVPIPTIPSHIRERGYDHMVMIAKRFAKQRGLKVEQALTRTTNTVQRQSGRLERKKQASRAFYCPVTLSDDTTYLLLDDVVTTGATVEYAARCLRRAGAGDVWVATIARQPLD